MKNSFFVKVHNAIDGILKFPNLKKGDIGIQIGFDLSSPNLTSDLWIMSNKVGATGQVIGIDPDPFNHKMMGPILTKANRNAQLVQKATYSERTETKLDIAQRASWNKLDFIPVDSKKLFTDETIQVQVDTVDNVINDLNIDMDKIRHVNITNNGAEYATLLGMKNLINNSDDLSLTIIAGRPGKMGQIQGKPDKEVIVDWLNNNGFETKYYKMSQLFWWGFIHQLLIKRKNVYKKNPYGVVMATKGKAKIKWYQSYC